MYFGVGLFASILFGTLCASWTYMCISFTKLGKFSFIIFKNRFPISCSFSSPSGTAMMQMLECLKLSRRLLPLSLFSGVLFYFCCLIGCFLLPYVPNHWFNFQFHPLYCCYYPVNCSLFQLVYPSFLTGSFYSVEVLTKFLEHPYRQCFEFCI